MRIDLTVTETPEWMEIDDTHEVDDTHETQITADDELEMANNYSKDFICVPDSSADVAHFEIIRESYKSQELSIMPVISPERIQNIQTTITPEIFSTITEWLIEVITIEFRFNIRTVHIATQLYCRYLCYKDTIKSELQLVALAALWIAAKYDEVKPGDAKDYQQMCGYNIVDERKVYTYSIDQLVKMENSILGVLSWELTIPTSVHFLHQFGFAVDFSLRERLMCEYVLALALVDFQHTTFLPSLLAASAIYLLRRVDNHLVKWTPTLERQTEYSIEDLKPCVKFLSKLLQEAPTSKLEYVFTYYSKSAQQDVAGTFAVFFEHENKTTPEKYIFLIILWNVVYKNDVKI